MPHDLAAQSASGRYTGQQDLDDAARLLLDDAGQHQVAVDDDGREQGHRS